MKSETRSLRFNVAINIGGGLVGLIGQLVALPIAIATVGPAEYGIWLVAFALAQIAALSDLGLTTAVARLMNVVPRNEWARLCSTSLALHVLLAVTLALSSLPVSILLLSRVTALDADRLVLAYLASLLCVPCMLIGRHFQGLNLGAEQFAAERTYQAAAIVLKVALLFWALVADANLLEVVVIECATFCLPAVLSAVFIRRTIVKWSPEYHWRSIDKGTGKSLIQLGWPMFTVNIVIISMALAPTIIVGALASSATATAVNAATRLSGAARQIVSWATEPLFPKSSVSNEDQRHELIATSTRSMLLLTSLVIVPSGLASTAAAQLWLGPEVGSVASPFLVNMLGALALFSGHTCFLVIAQGAGFPRTFRKIYLWWAVSTLGGLAAAIQVKPNLAPYVFAVAAATVAVMSLVQIRRYAPTRTWASLWGLITSFALRSALALVSAYCLTAVTDYGLANYLGAAISISFYYCAFSVFSITPRRRGDAQKVLF